MTTMGGEVHGASLHPELSSPYLCLSAQLTDRGATHHHLWCRLRKGVVSSMELNGTQWKGAVSVRQAG